MFTDDWIKQRIASNPSLAAVNPGLGSSSVVQKREVHRGADEAAGRDVERKPDAANKARVKKVDGSSRQCYRVHVVFRVSDKRVRDNPGMLETICDVLIAAGRRLAGFGDR